MCAPRQTNINDFCNVAAFLARLFASAYASGPSASMPLGMCDSADSMATGSIHKSSSCYKGCAQPRQDSNIVEAFPLDSRK